MNNEIKVSLTIELPGSTMFSKKECLKTTQKVIKKKIKNGTDYDIDKMNKHTMKIIGKNTRHPEIITFYTRKAKSATQSINIYQEAYNYMISKECPSWSKPKEWNKMKIIQRLESHLQRIAENFKGKIISYKIFED